MNPILQIKGVLKNYSWGRRGSSSIVGALSGGADSGQPCAELWFGAHPQGPSPVVGSDQTLDKIVSADPNAVLGTRIAETFGGSLPFLFKILSIETALSIQAHPNSVRAAQLHRAAPQHYPDSSHKPEIAVAVSGLSYLAGFNSAVDLRETLERIPELALVFGPAAGAAVALPTDLNSSDLAARAMFCHLFRLPGEILIAAAERVRDRILWLGSQSAADRWFIKLYDKFGPAGDPGLFCFYLLRHDRLDPGQALFTGPNIVHAYLEGDIVECMANSDNVVRAGLTEKYRDVETLISMVNENSSSGTFDQPVKFNGSGSNAALVSYRCAAKEFAVERIDASPLSLAAAVEGEPEMLVSLDAAGSIEFGGRSEPIAAGSAFFKTAVSRGYKLKIDRGSCFRVTVPTA